MISLLLLAAAASAAPQYGPPPPLPTTAPVTAHPEKLILPVTVPTLACTVTYVTIWDTEYQVTEKEVSSGIL